MIECEWEDCTVAGKHRAECVDGECAGCRPRPAERGKLCIKHWSWLNRDLAQAAEVAVEVRESMVRGPAGNDGPSRVGPCVPPMPFDPAAVDAVDELVALLASVAETVGPQVFAAPPDVPVRRFNHVAQGIRSTVSADDVGAVVSRLVSWFRVRLDDVAALPDILDLGPDLHRMVDTMLHRWPAVEPPRHVPGVPCRECDLMDMWRTPPSAECWPVVVECHSCGYVAPEEDLTRIAKLAEFDASQRRKVRRSA